MKRKCVQIYNKEAKCFTKIDQASGEIVACKKTKGPYKNLLIRAQKTEDGRYCFDLGNGEELTLNNFRPAVIGEVWGSKP